MKDDKIAQALNMRPLEEAEEERQEALDRLNPDKLPDLPANAFTTNDEVDSIDSVKNLPQESVAQVPAVVSKEAEENLKDIELANKTLRILLILVMMQLKK